MEIFQAAAERIKEGGSQIQAQPERTVVSKQPRDDVEDEVTTEARDAVSKRRRVPGGYVSIEVEELADTMKETGL